jgi:hypothetical protein
MQSIAHAMLWEFFRKIRWSSIPFLIFAVVGWILPLSSFRNTSIDLSNPEFVLMHLVFSFLSILSVAIGMSTFQSPASRYYTFPISTVSLVAWKLLLPSAVVGFVIAVVFAVINLVWSIELPILSISLFAIAFTSPIFLFILQSSQSFWTLSCGGAIIFGLGYWGRTHYGEPASIPMHLWRVVTLADLATMLGAILLSYAIAFRVVHTDRCGEPLFSRQLVEKLSGLWSIFRSRSSSSLPALRSPQQAQYWYERRQKGAAMPAIVGLAVSMALLPLPIHFAFYGFTGALEFTNFTIEGLYHGLFVFGMLFILFAVFSGVYTGFSNFGDDKRYHDPSLSELVNHDQLLRMGAFQATLPIVPCDYSFAILRTMIQSLFATWSAWFVLFVCVAVALRIFLPEAFPQEFDRIFGFWGVPITLLGPWIVMSNVASIGLTGRNVLVFAAFLTAVAMIVATSFGSATIESKQMTATFAYGGFVVVLIVVVLGTVYAFWEAVRRNLIRNRTVTRAAAALILIVVVAILLAPWKLVPLAYLAILGFAALTVLPFATIPLAISWNRHR